MCIRDSTGTDAYGCFSSDTLTITMYEKPQGSIPHISPVFESEPLMLTAGDWSNAMTYTWSGPCLLYTSDAADERSSVDLGGRRLIKQKKRKKKKTQRLV